MSRSIVFFCGLVLGLSCLFASASAQLPACTACEFFTGYLTEAVGQDRSPSHIESVLNSFCQRLPTFVQSQCSKWVHDNRIQLALILNSGSTPTDICKRLGACKGTRVEARNEVAAANMIGGDAGCDVCIMTIWEVQRQVKNNLTVDNIVSVLTQVCAAMPIFQDQCNAWVKNDLSNLVRYLMDRDSAQQICQYLGACQNSTHHVDPKVAFARQKVFQYIVTHPLNLAGNSGGCQLCQWVISAFEAWLSDGHTQAEITSFLQQVCPFFNEYSSQCQQLVEVYTPKLIENLIQSETPPVVCTQFGVCPAN